MEAHGHIEERRIAEAFDRIDSDDSGYISRQNLRELLGNDYSKERLDALVADADTDGDGRISYSEFLAIFRKRALVMAEELATVDQPDEPGPDSTLVGLDAKIPGGRYDSSLPDSLKAQVEQQ